MRQLSGMFEPRDEVDRLVAQVLQPVFDGGLVEKVFRKIRDQSGQLFRQNWNANCVQNQTKSRFVHKVSIGNL